MKTIRIASWLLAIILQPASFAAQSCHLLSTKDYFPATPGNIWIKDILSDDPLVGKYYALNVFQQFKYDSSAYVLLSGFSDPPVISKDTIKYNWAWFSIKFVSPYLINQGHLVPFDQVEYHFVTSGAWLDISDSTKLISIDSTVTCPCGTFYHCIVDQRGKIWAPGFGPVSENLVYAKVNGVEYGTMPTASDVESDRPRSIPRENALYPAYPNPFNQSTRISFYLNKPGPARLTIFDAQGRTVRVLLKEQAAGGSHHLTWDGMTDDHSFCPSGVYYVFLRSAGFSQKQALTLVR